ncbi:MAG: hypothetical protein ACK5AN_14860, partial [Planctomyces sp.]
VQIHRFYAVNTAQRNAPRLQFQKGHQSFARNGTDGLLKTNRGSPELSPPRIAISVEIHETSIQNHRAGASLQIRFCILARTLAETTLKFWANQAKP